MYLERNEFEALMTQTDWKALAAVPENNHKVFKCLQRIRETALASKTHIFFTCPANYLYSFIQTLLEFFDKQKYQTEEPETEAKEVVDESTMIAELFGEAPKPASQLASAPAIASPSKNCTNTDKLDGARYALLKIEEALTL